MPRKSKSSKRKKASKSNKSSSKNVNVSEINVEKQSSDEGAKASFKTKNYDPKTSDEGASASFQVKSYDPKIPNESATASFQTEDYYPNLSDEGATASYKLGNYDPKASEEIDVYLDDGTFRLISLSLAESKERLSSAFKKSESIESSKSELPISISLQFSKSPTRSDSVQPPRFIESPVRTGSVETSELQKASVLVESLGSFKSESIELPVRSESVESLLRSELLERAVSSNSVESLVSFRSELIGTPVRSELNESLESNISESPRPKSAEPRAKSKSAKSLRRISSEPILTSTLTQRAAELLYTQLMRKRQSNFFLLLDSSFDMEKYMDYVVTLLIETDDKNVIVKTRWKEKDSSDWFDLIKLWIDVQDEIKIFMCIIQNVYQNYSEHISVTTSEFRIIIETLEDVFNKISQFLKRCTNSYNRYSRFCESKKDTIFLKNISDYRKKIFCFQKKIKIELDKFTALYDLTVRDL